MTEPELLLQGRRFLVERVMQVMPDGSEHPRDVVRHPDAVAILPLLDDGLVCFIENFRVAAGKKLIELPAGVLEPGECPVDAARRELIEETGYRAEKIEHFGSFFTSPGVLTEQMHLFLATGLIEGQAAPEPGEDLRPFHATWQEALQMVRDGRIEDAKTVAGLLRYEAFGGPGGG